MSGYDFKVDADDEETSRIISEIENGLGRAIQRRRIYLLIGVVGFLVLLLFVPEQKASLGVPSCGPFAHQGLKRTNISFCMLNSTTTAGHVVIESSVLRNELVNAQRYVMTGVVNRTTGTTGTTIHWSTLTLGRTPSYCNCVIRWKMHFRQY